MGPMQKNFSCVMKDLVPRREYLSEGRSVDTVSERLRKQNDFAVGCRRVPVTAAKKTHEATASETWR